MSEYVQYNCGCDVYFCENVLKVDIQVHETHPTQSSFTETGSLFAIPTAMHAGRRPMPGKIVVRLFHSKHIHICKLKYGFCLLNVRYLCSRISFQWFLSAKSGQSQATGLRTQQECLLSLIQRFKAHLTYFSINLRWNSDLKVSFTKCCFDLSISPLAQFLKTTSSSHLENDRRCQ